MEPFYQKWIRTIAQSHRVNVVAGGDARSRAEKFVSGVHNVEFVPIETNDIWIRDYGPIFVHRDGEVVAVSFKYNAWGGKYPPWDRDAAAAERIASYLKVPVISSSMGAEGGALEFDGTGRLLTSPNCLIDPNRNDSPWNKERISQELHRCLGVDEIVWVDGGGIDGDDTDGHIDQLARFIDPENLVVAVADPSDEHNHAGLEDNFRQLKLWGDQTSPNVNVHRMPIPPLRFIDDYPVPQSYCNYLRLGANRILVPTFDSPTDDYAMGLISDLAGFAVEGLDCRDLAWGLGALHCASCEQPMPAEQTAPAK
jgi:agmatine deiminase